MYTTNVMGNLNRIFRKPTKTRVNFSIDISLMGILYLYIINLAEKWKLGHLRGCSPQLAIEYEERLKV